MRKSAQNCDLHFVSVKSTNFKSYSIRIFIQLFLLLTIFCIQTQVQAQQKNLPITKPSSVVQNPKQTLDSLKLTLRYDIPKLKAGQSGISKPIVNVEGGVYSYEILEGENEGNLIFNPTTGLIDSKFCFKGKYLIKYKLKGEVATTLVTVY